MKKTLVMVMHRKIVYVKVESSIIEIFESVHWSRRCYAIIFISVRNEFLLGTQGTVNQTTSCQHTLSKQTSAADWRGTAVWESKRTHVPVFYRGNKIWVLILVLVHSWFNSYAPELVSILYYRDKTRVHMFYFLNVSNI